MSKVITTAILAVAFIAATTLPAAAQEEKTCEEWRCDFQATLEQECDCTGKSNHGRYVSCVAHAVKDLVDEGLPRNCKGKLKRCAARSVCGKQERGFVTCSIPVDFGTCVGATTLDPTGICDNTGLECMTDDDCIVTKCKIKRGEEKCLAKGGTVNTAPSCCSSCAVPAS